MNLLKVGVIHLLLVLVLGAATLVLCYDISFSYFPNDLGFGYCSTHCKVALNCSGNAGCQISSATRDPALVLIPFGTGNNRDIGVRFMRDEKVQLWDSASGITASVRTFFVMRISQVAGYSTGDGLTFLIAPDPVTPDDSQGGNLGLFDADDHGNPANGEDPKVVAIKFDTHNNTKFNDPPAPYVGLDINSLVSSVHTHLDEDLIGQVDFFNTKFGVWMEYNGTSQSLEVSILMWPEGGGFGSAPKLRGRAASAFTYTLDLKSAVEEYSYVGFSAGSGHDFEINEVFYWEFETTGLGAAPLHALSHALKLALLALVLLLALLLFCCCLCCTWRRRRKKQKQAQQQAVLPSVLLGDVLLATGKKDERPIAVNVTVHNATTNEVEKKNRQGSKANALKPTVNRLHDIAPRVANKKNVEHKPPGHHGEGAARNKKHGPLMPRGAKEAELTVPKRRPKSPTSPDSLKGKAMRAKRIPKREDRGPPLSPHNEVLGKQHGPHRPMTTSGQTEPHGKVTHDANRTHVVLGNKTVREAKQEAPMNTQPKPHRIDVPTNHRENMSHVVSSPNMELSKASTSEATTILSDVTTRSSMQSGARHPPIWAPWSASAASTPTPRSPPPFQRDLSTHPTSSASVTSLARSSLLHKEPPKHLDATTSLATPKPSPSSSRPFLAPKPSSHGTLEQLQASGSSPDLDDTTHGSSARPPSSHPVSSLTSQPVSRQTVLKSSPSSSNASSKFSTPMPHNLLVPLPSVHAVPSAPTPSYAQSTSLNQVRHASSNKSFVADPPPRFSPGPFAPSPRSTSVPPAPLVEYPSPQGITMSTPHDVQPPRLSHPTSVRLPSTSALSESPIFLHAQISSQDPKLRAPSTSPSVHATSRSPSPSYDPKSPSHHAHLVRSTSTDPVPRFPSPLSGVVPSTSPPPTNFEPSLQDSPAKFPSPSSRSPHITDPVPRFPPPLSRVVPLTSPPLTNSESSLQDSPTKFLSPSSRSPHITDPAPRFPPPLSGAMPSTSPPPINYESSLQDSPAKFPSLSSHSSHIIDSIPRFPPPLSEAVPSTSPPPTNFEPSLQDSPAKFPSPSSCSPHITDPVPRFPPPLSGAVSSTSPPPTNSEPSLQDSPAKLPSSTSRSPHIVSPHPILASHTPLDRSFSKHAGPNLKSLPPLSAGANTKPSVPPPSEAGFSPNIASQAPSSNQTIHEESIPSPSTDVEFAWPIAPSYVVSPESLSSHAGSLPPKVPSFDDSLHSSSLLSDVTTTPYPTYQDLSTSPTIAPAKSILSPIEAESLDPNSASYVSSPEGLHSLPPLLANVSSKSISPPFNVESSTHPLSHALLSRSTSAETISTFSPPSSIESPQPIPSSHASSHTPSSAPAVFLLSAPAVFHFSAPMDVMSPQPNSTAHAKLATPPSSDASIKALTPHSSLESSKSIPSPSNASSSSYPTSQAPSTSSSLAPTTFVSFAPALVNPPLPISSSHALSHTPSSALAPSLLSAPVVLPFSVFADIESSQPNSPSYVASSSHTRSKFLPPLSSSGSSKSLLAPSHGSSSSHPTAQAPSTSSSFAHLAPVSFPPAQAESPHPSPLSHAPSAGLLSPHPRSTSLPPSAAPPSSKSFLSTTDARFSPSPTSHAESTNSSPTSAPPISSRPQNVESSQPYPVPHVVSAKLSSSKIASKPLAPHSPSESTRTLPSLSTVGSEQHLTTHALPAKSPPSYVESARSHSPSTPRSSKSLTSRAPSPVSSSSHTTSRTQLPVIGVAPRTYPTSSHAFHSADERARSLSPSSHTPRNNDTCARSLSPPATKTVRRSRPPSSSPSSKATPRTGPFQSTKPEDVSTHLPHRPSPPLTAVTKTALPTIPADLVHSSQNVKPNTSTTSNFVSPPTHSAHKPHAKPSHPPSDKHPLQSSIQHEAKTFSAASGLPHASTHAAPSSQHSEHARQRHVALRSTQPPSTHHTPRGSPSPHAKFRPPISVPTPPSIPSSFVLSSVQASSSSHADLHPPSHLLSPSSPRDLSTPDHKGTTQNAPKGQKSKKSSPDSRGWRKEGLVLGSTKKHKPQETLLQKTRESIFEFLGLQKKIVLTKPQKCKIWIPPGPTT